MLSCRVWLFFSYLFNIILILDVHDHFGVWNVNIPNFLSSTGSYTIYMYQLSAIFFKCSEVNSLRSRFTQYLSNKHPPPPTHNMIVIELFYRGWACTDQVSWLIFYASNYWYPYIKPSYLVYKQTMNIPICNCRSTYDSINFKTSPASEYSSLGKIKVILYFIQQYISKIISPLSFFSISLDRKGREQSSHDPYKLPPRLHRSVVYRISVYLCSLIFR